MSVACPNCRSAVPAAEVKADRHLAWCPRCRSPFPLPVPPLPAGTVPPLPAGVEVTDDGVSRRIAFRWFHPGTLLTVLFCVAWDAFLIFWYSKALAPWPAVNWGAVHFPLGHVAVGVAMKYRTLCDLVNRTAVEAGDAVRVPHGPLPWPGAELPATDVTAVYCEPVVHRGKGSARVDFRLRAATEGGPTVTLLAGLDSLPRARFFEWQIEAWLDLRPRRVPGEAA